MKTREDVANRVEAEGLDYFLLNYTSADSMPDPELKAAFTKAREALIAFNALLPDLDDDDDEYGALDEGDDYDLPGTDDAA